MTNKRKLISLLLIVSILLFCITGCGGNNSQTNNSQTNTETTDTVEDPSSAEETINNDALISPELKEFLDSYEAFMDEYCEFMKSYSTSDTSKMMEYLQILQKYTDFAEKANAWKDKELNDAETLYYLEVLNRVNAKLLELTN